MWSKREQREHRKEQKSTAEQKNQSKTQNLRLAENSAEWNGTQENKNRENKAEKREETRTE